MCAVQLPSLIWGSSSLASLHANAKQGTYSQWFCARLCSCTTQPCYGVQCCLLAVITLPLARLQLPSNTTRYAVSRGLRAASCHRGAAVTALTPVTAWASTLHYVPCLTYKRLADQMRSTHPRKPSCVWLLR
jgi:hypothetical protein